MRHIYLVLLVITLCAVNIGHATSIQVHAQNTPEWALPPAPPSLSPDRSAFRNRYTVKPVDIVVPTLIEVPLPNDAVGRYHFAVEDNTDEQFIPSLYREPDLVPLTPFAIQLLPEKSNVSRQLMDHNPNTYVEVPLTNTVSSVTFRIHTAAPLAATGVRFELDRFVAMPKQISVSLLDEATEKIILALTNVSGHTVYFPRTEGTSWDVTFSYDQPLRITELSLLEEQRHTDTPKMRFLAQPNHAYTIYADPDRAVAQAPGDSTYLFDNNDVVVVQPQQRETNPFYTPADTDHDGVPDESDNCDAEKNKDQLDIDGNGTGDACDDFDHDGIIQAQDNCPHNPNQDQADADGDTLGDACDTEENRLTEQYPWLPWAGMGIAGLVLCLLFALTMREMKQQAPSEDTTTSQ